GNKEEVVIKFKDSGLNYLHGGKSNLDVENASTNPPPEAVRRLCIRVVNHPRLRRSCELVGLTFEYVKPNQPKAAVEWLVRKLLFELSL
nr:hypothetical protein [Tanacetum cinerariifolium]